MNNCDPQLIHILPQGAFASEVFSLARTLGFSEFKFYDDHPKPGTLNLKDLPKNGVACVAVGDPATRKTIVKRLAPALDLPSLIHPQALLMETGKITIGKGCIITAGVILTTNIKVGDFVLLNLHSSVGHNCVLGDFSSLMPGARLSGGVILEKAVYIGTNACVLPNIRIGENAVVGAGAVVTKDVAANTTVVGVPAKPKTQTN
jgi:sugar O-acyltransferase (sialic acid O-acetyltransferase NeuD family)